MRVNAKILLDVPELSDGTVCLRKFRPEDAPAMYRNWAADDEVTRYLRWPSHASVGETQVIVDGWVAAYGRLDALTWAVELARPLGAAVTFAAGEPIGSIGVVGWNDLHDVPEVGYCLGRAWWGHRLATRALELVLDMLFSQVGVPAFEAGHDVRNPALGAVMAHCGMTRLPGVETGETWSGPREMARWRVTRVEWLARTGGGRLA